MNTVKNIIPIRGNQQMNNQLPEPPVPADCDLRTFRYMPFDVARFRDSRFSAVIDPAAGFFAIQLWAAAWHQVPAGSLPNEDAMLRMLSGCGRDQLLWDSVKDGALYGFAPHADGRLYHPAITEFVIEAYGKLLKNTENGKKGGRPPKPSANPTLTDGKPNANPTLTQHEPSEVKGSEGKREDKHTVQKTTSNPPSAEETATANAFAVCVSDGFKSIWQSMPLPRVNKLDAEKAWKKACKGKSVQQVQKGIDVITQDLADRAAHVAGYDSPFLKTHLSTYINGQMWKDEDMPQRFAKLKA